MWGENRTLRRRVRPRLLCERFTGFDGTGKQIKSWKHHLCAYLLQEMSNPLVRPNLHFFPERNGISMGNAYEGQHWLEEMDEGLLTPVITRGSQKYFIFEPVVLENHTCCIPVRWYMQSGELYAKAWRIRRGRVFGPDGWIALEYDCIRFPVSHLAVSFPYFQHSYSHRNLPDPANILGEFSIL